MIMYYHENNNDYKFILMCFINNGDDVHGSTDAEHDGDQMIHHVYVMILVNHLLYLKIIKNGCHIR